MDDSKDTTIGSKKELPPLRWLDEEGASLMSSLRKACVAKPGDFRMGMLLRMFLALPLMEQSGSPESCALGVAHLLPLILECDQTY